MFKKIIIGIFLGISSLLAFQLPEYQVTICDSSKNPAVINSMTPYDLSNSVVLPLKMENKRYAKEVKIPTSDDIKKNNYFYGGGNILKEPFEMLEWAHSCSKHKYIENNIIDSRVLFTYEKDRKNFIRHTVYSPPKKRVFFNKEKTKYHFKIDKAINLNKINLKDDEEIIISTRNFRQKVKLNNNIINLEFAVRIYKDTTMLFPDVDSIKHNYQVISSNNYGQLRVKKSDFDKKNKMLAIEILGFFYSKGNNADLSNIEKNNKELLIKKLNQLFDIKLTYRTSSSSSASSLNNILMDLSAGKKYKDAIKKSDEIRREKNRRIEEVSKKLLKKITIDEEKKILDKDIHSIDEIQILFSDLSSRARSRSYNGNTFISLSEYTLNRFGFNSLKSDIFRILRPKNYEDLDKIKDLIDKYKINMRTNGNYLYNMSSRFALENYKNHAFLEKVFKRHKNEKTNSKYLINTIIITIIKESIDLEAKIIYLEKDIEKLENTGQEEQISEKRKKIENLEDEKAKKLLKSSKEIILIYELFEKYGANISDTIGGNVLLDEKRFKFLSHDLREFLYRYYNITDTKRSLEKTFKAKGSQGFGKSSEIIEYLEWFNYSIPGQIIKYLFFILLACYYFFDIKKSLQIRRFNKQKHILIKKTKEFFHENKSSSKQKIPVLELTNISKKLDLLIKEYDKNYISLLQFGLYFKSKKDMYQKIKDTLETLESQIEKLLIEKSKIEEKYKDKEKEFLLLNELKEELLKYRYKLYNESVKNQFVDISIQIDLVGEKVLNEDINNEIAKIKERVVLLIKEIDKEAEEAEEQENILTKKDPHEILGVSKDDTIKDIKRVWKRLSIKYHPDRHVDISKEQKTKFEEISKIINGAWDDISRKSKNDE